ncbi:unnamed protein product [Paramecium sonneborni]|uniref:Uncharacterized protein n=1 Tax=Paramecium sonneborni TaxID=65129 RepID=A0A8S1RM03_9CILI|nr:unnamed protein product [Paramecium sonneborni]
MVQFDWKNKFNDMISIIMQRMRHCTFDINSFGFIWLDLDFWRVSVIF